MPVLAENSTRKIRQPLQIGRHRRFSLAISKNTRAAPNLPSLLRRGKFFLVNVGVRPDSPGAPDHRSPATNLFFGSDRASRSQSHGNQYALESAMQSPCSVADRRATLRGSRYPEGLWVGQSRALPTTSHQPRTSFSARTEPRAPNLGGTGRSGKKMVEATGFEPATSCSQSKRSTKLSYASINRVYRVRRRAL